MNKEDALVYVAEARALGIAFVEDDYQTDSEGVEIYNPSVDRQNAEQWLLDLLMKIK